MTGWTPVAGHDPERGDTYCSPRCGGRCRKRDYDYCVERAQTLANLLGEGWKPRVWENLGWHYEAYRGSKDIGEGRVSVSPNYHHTLEKRYILRGYTCFFNGPKQFVEGSDDPLTAYRDARLAAIAHMQAMTKFLGENPDA